MKLFLINFFNAHLRTFFRCFQTEEERKKGRERLHEREKYRQWPPVHAQTENHTCSDWGSNLQTFSYGTMFQPTEPHWPG